MNLAAVTRNGRGYWIEIYGSEATLVLGSANQADYVHGFQLLMARPGEPLRPLEADPSLAFPRTWEDGRIAPVRRLLGWWSEAISEGSADGARPGGSGQQPALLRSGPPLAGCCQRRRGHPLDSRPDPGRAVPARCPHPASQQPFPFTIFPARYILWLSYRFACCSTMQQKTVTAFLPSM